MEEGEVDEEKEVEVDEEELAHLFDPAPHGPGVPAGLPGKLVPVN